MKNTSIVLFAVLFLSVAGLYIMHFSENKSHATGKAGEKAVVKDLN